MSKVIVWAKTETWTAREADPNDRWDAGDTEGRVNAVSALIKTDDHETESWGDSICKDIPGVAAGDTLYAVVADYSSGSTFGRDGGHASVIDAFTGYEEAKDLAVTARVVGRSTFLFWHGGKEYYSPWTGYFESLNGVEVWKIAVNGNLSEMMIS